ILTHDGVTQLGYPAELRKPGQRMKPCREPSDGEPLGHLLDLPQVLLIFRENRVQINKRFAAQFQLSSGLQGDTRAPTFETNDGPAFCFNDRLPTMLRLKRTEDLTYGIFSSVPQCESRFFMDSKLLAFGTNQEVRARPLVLLKHCAQVVSP